MHEPSPSLELDAVDHWLAAAHIPVVAAEAQGLLCGLLCAGAADARERWLTELCNAEAGRPTSADVPEQLYAQTVAGLADPELGFSPLLPDEARPLTERAQAVRDWCQGFLYGMGLAGAGPKPALSDEAREMLRDFSEIACLDVTAVEANEENEQALAELIEFIRVAVMLVYTEAAAQRERNA